MNLPRTLRSLADAIERYEVAGIEMGRSRERLETAVERAGLVGELLRRVILPDPPADTPPAFVEVEIVRPETPPKPLDAPVSIEAFAALLGIPAAMVHEAERVGAIPSRALLRLDPDPRIRPKVIPLVAMQAWRPTCAVERIEELLRSAPKGSA